MSITSSGIEIADTPLDMTFGVQPTGANYQEDLHRVAILLNRIDEKEGGRQRKPLTEPYEGNAILAAVVRFQTVQFGGAVIGGSVLPDSATLYRLNALAFPDLDQGPLEGSLRARIVEKAASKLGHMNDLELEYICSSVKTEVNKHWCGIFAAHVWHECGVDVSWVPGKALMYNNLPVEPSYDLQALAPGDIGVMEYRWHHYIIAQRLAGGGAADTIEGNWAGTLVNDQGEAEWIAQGVRRERRDTSGKSNSAFADKARHILRRAGIKDEFTQEWCGKHTAYFYSLDTPLLGVKYV